MSPPDAQLSSLPGLSVGLGRANEGWHGIRVGVLNRGSWAEVTGGDKELSSELGAVKGVWGDEHLGETEPVLVTLRPARKLLAH